MLILSKCSGEVFTADFICQTPDAQLNVLNIHNCALLVQPILVSTNLQPGRSFPRQRESINFPPGSNARSHPTQCSSQSLCTFRFASKLGKNGHFRIPSNLAPLTLLFTPDSLSERRRIRHLCLPCFDPLQPILNIRQLTYD
jgi:hypothetical protein